MKIIIERDGWQDFVITQDSRVVKINNGNNIKYTDEPNGIAEYTRYVKDIYFYEDEYSDGGKTGNAKRIILKKEHILALADKIREIEKEVFEDIYVPDELPW